MLGYFISARSKTHTVRAVGAALIALCMHTTTPASAAAMLDAQRIEEISGTKATTAADGVVRIGWSRSDVPVTVDGMSLPPASGLGSWAAFAPMAHGAMVMGDTVVFEDEIDAAMDAAFAHGLSVTALHNHFAYDAPKVYFMHIGGEGKVDDIAGAVKSVWDAIRSVRSSHATPATGFGGPTPTAGHVSADAVAMIVGSPATDTQGVAKITIGRTVSMNGMNVGESMGVTTWVALAGNDALAAADGDIVMSGKEVQPVLKALRVAHFHVVALHQHMIDTTPILYFTHFWGNGSAADLARGFRAVLDAQKSAK